MYVRMSFAVRLVCWGCIIFHGLKPLSPIIDLNWTSITEYLTFSYLAKPPMTAGSTMPFSSIDSGFMGRLSSPWYWLIMVRIFSLELLIVSMAFSKGLMEAYEEGRRLLWARRGAMWVSKIWFLSQTVGQFFYNCLLMFSETRCHFLKPLHTIINKKNCTHKMHTTMGFCTFSDSFQTFCV